MSIVANTNTDVATKTPITTAREYKATVSKTRAVFVFLHLLL